MIRVTKVIWYITAATKIVCPKIFLMFFSRFIFRMPAVPIPRQVIDSDAVLAESWCAFRFFFPLCWERGRVPCIWENSAVLVRFGKSSKEYELDKLRKFTLNQHFSQTFVNYNLSSDLVLWNCALHIQFLYFKSFHFGSLQQIGNFRPLLGKKDTIWHWDWVLIMDPNSLEKNPWHFNQVVNGTLLILLGSLVI